MLKNVLIGTNVSYTSAANPSLLAAGEIGVYSVAVDGTYSLITSAISAAQALLPVVIAQGAPAGKNVKMFTIQPKEKTAYLNTAYLAPRPNVFVAGYDGVTAAYNVTSGAAGTYDLSST
jgi:L-cysteine desulfidase